MPALSPTSAIGPEGWRPAFEAGVQWKSHRVLKIGAYCAFDGCRHHLSASRMARTSRPIIAAEQALR
jgi:hypothetical protein